MKATLLAIKCFFVFLFISNSGILEAQLNPYVPYTVSSIPGTGLSIPQHLAQGKYVLIDVFEYHCQACYNTPQSGILNQFYADYGPGGSNEVMVIAISNNPFHIDDTQAEVLPGVTVSDWNATFSYPRIYEEYFAEKYGVVQEPSLIWICPDGSMTEFSPLNYAELEALLDTQCPDPPPTNNLSINGLISMNTGCGSSKLSILNTGTSNSGGFSYEAYVNGVLTNTNSFSQPLEFLRSLQVNLGVEVSYGDEVQIILNYADENAADNTLIGVVGSDLPPHTNRFRAEYMVGGGASNLSLYAFQGGSSPYFFDEVEGGLQSYTYYEQEFYLNPDCYEMVISGELDQVAYLNLINLDEFGASVDTIWKIRPYEFAFETTKYFNAQIILDPEYQVCVFLDANENGVFDSEEEMIAGVEIEYGGQLVYTTLDGCVTLAGGTAGEIVTINQDETLFPVVTTANSIELLPLNTNYNFGLSTNDPNFSLNSELTIFESFSCESSSPIQIQVCNNGNVSTGGEFILELDPQLTPLSANNGGELVGNTVTWSIEDLSLGQCQFFTVFIEAPALELIGEIVTYSSVTTTFDDLGNIVSVENDVATGVIECSYDPNDKQVWPAGETEAGYIQNGTELEYMIRFQNTGNAPATNVRVDDDLDSDLNWQTFELISTSHYCEPSINTENGHVEFYFPDIMLPDSTNNEPESHGFIRYKVSLQPDREEGTPVENTAYIYFDFNPAVVTNTTLNTVSDLYFGIESAARKQLVMYPNPTSNSLLIELGEIKGAFTLNLYSAMGSLVKSEKMNASNQMILSVNDYPAGMYTLEIIPDSDSQDVYMGRFVKQ